jgi:hypothetical protein
MCDFQPRAASGGAFTTGDTYGTLPLLLASVCWLSEEFEGKAPVLVRQLIGATALSGAPAMWQWRPVSFVSPFFLLILLSFFFKVSRPAPAGWKVVGMRGPPWC